MFDPSVSLQRSIDLYRAKGYDEDWISKRIKGIQDRKRLTDVWNDNGITKEQAKQIATFVKKHYGNVEQIIVHCEAGISRSAGVAAAILKYFTNDDSQIFDSYKYRPNTLCYRNVLEALYDE